MFEWHDCDLKFCTFYCNGKCLSRKREECPYVGYFDSDFMHKKLHIPDPWPCTDEDSRE